MPDPPASDALQLINLVESTMAPACTAQQYKTESVWMGLSLVPTRQPLYKLGAVMKLTLLRLAAVLNLVAAAGCGIVAGGSAPAHAAMACVEKGDCVSKVTVTDSEVGKGCTVTWEDASFEVQDGVEDVVLRWLLVRKERSTGIYSWATQSGVTLKWPPNNDLDIDLSPVGAAQPYFAWQAINKSVNQKTTFGVKFVVLRAQGNDDQGKRIPDVPCKSKDEGSIVLRVPKAK